MPIFARIAFKAAATVATALAVVLAIVWPWPAPEVDWRTPLEIALAQNDCRRVAAIVNAAAFAGSIEAMDRRAELARGNICADEWPPTVYGDAETVRILRQWRANASLDKLYGLDEHTFGTWRTWYLRAAIFLCVAPYAARHRTDYVAMSSSIPNDGGWIMALHRQRRSFCIAILENVAEPLVESGDVAAQRLAEKLLSHAPLRESTHASYLYAKLIFEKGFERDPPPSDAQLAAIHRNMTWRTLRNAAEKGHAEAILLIVRLLHEGRAVPRNDNEAYYWVLRARRLGHSPSPFAAEIEGARAAGDRERTIAKENLDWLLLQDAQRARQDTNPK